MSNIFQTEISNLNGGFIIPPFISNDPDLDAELRYKLSELLYIQHLSKSHGNGKYIVFKDKFYNDHERHCLMIDVLKEMNYINVTSRMELVDRTELKIIINPWYLQYIDMDPFYTDYQDEYFEFLKDVVLSKLPDSKKKKKLKKYILDN